MYGYLETGAYRLPHPRQIAGVWFLAAAVPKGDSPWARWHRRRVLRRLSCMGVRRCVMAESLWAEALSWALRPVEVSPLRQTLLPQLLSRFADLHGGCALLRSPYTDGAVWAAASVLARQARYLALDIPRGGEELALALRSRYGVCAAQPSHPRLTVSFAGAPRDGHTICLGADCAAYQTVQYGAVEVVPPDCPAPEQLLSALWQADALKKETLEVKSIDTRP